MKIAVVGAGFWSNFQIAGWGEVPGAQVVAICNRTLSRAEQVAARFGLNPYPDFDSMVDAEKPDLIDIITGVETHAYYVLRAANRGIPVICQKPMAVDLAEAERMVAACQASNVPLFINENWRYQTPLLRLKHRIDAGEIGRPFRARIQFSCSFPVFDNQPFLKTIDRFILTDIGSHILDTARFMFGEASTLYCQTSRINPEIVGEDVATVMMNMSGCDTVTCEMSYASKLRDEACPQTYVVIEGTRGSLELRKDYQILGPGGDEHATPPSYPWADPAYDLVHSSIVACQQAIFDDLTRGIPSGLKGHENLRTVRLVFGSYDSAERQTSISILN
jgi:D-apiose dehydrogenase